jgi:antitoxin VapB
MATAKIFRSRNSQAVQLPKEFRVSGKELEIFRRGDEIILREKKGAMRRAFELLAAVPSELITAGRKNDRPQKRNWMNLEKRGRS